MLFVLLLTLYSYDIRQLILLIESQDINYAGEQIVKLEEDPEFREIGIPG